MDVMKAAIEEYGKELDKALLTLDEKTIRQFSRKWSNPLANADSEVFWVGVHKAITGRTTLPKKFRRASKDWLEERGYKSFDDGDI